MSAARVKQPGREIYVGKTTVTKAITSAGDFTDYASHNVKLIRANGGSHQSGCGQGVGRPHA